MDAPFDPIQRVLRGAGVVCAGAAALVGVAVLVGWAFGWDRLTRVSPRFVPMKPLAAASLVAVGGATLLLGWRQQRWSRTAARAAGIATVIVAAVSGTEYLVDRTILGFDRLLFAGRLGPEPDSGRMAPWMAVALLLLGMAVIAAAGRGRSRAAVPFLAGGAGVVGYVGTLGYLYGVSSLYQVRPYASMAFLASIGAVVASVALLLTVPDRAPVVMFCDRGAAGRLTRRLAPAVVIGVPALGWVRLWGQRAGLYDTAFGLAIMVMSLVLIFGVLNWRAGRAILTSEAALVSANLALEDRVAVRTAELAASEERFRAVATSAPEAIVVADDTGTIIYANPAAIAMFGPSPDGLAGRPVTDLMPARWRSAHRQGLARYLATGEAAVLGDVRELTATRENGEEFPVELSISTWEADGRTFFAGIARDVSDKHRSEAARRTEAETAALVGRATRAAAAATDLAAAVNAFGEVVRTGVPVDGVCLGVHRGSGVVEVAGGWGSAPFAIGRKLTLGDDPRWESFRDNRVVAVADTAALPADCVDPALTEAGIRSYVSVPIVAGGEVRVLTSFWANRPAAFPSAVVARCERLARAAAGPFNILLLLDREREAARRLRELDALKNEFVAIVAHDLRSPLAVISGFARVVRDDWAGLGDERRTEILDRIVTRTDRLSDLVSDVLEVARIESGADEYQASPFDVVELVRRIVAEIGTGAHRACEVHVGADLPLAVGDELSTSRVLTNLLSNAVKFSPPDAPIVVEVGAAAGEVRVSVTDQGPGFAPEDRDRLFQKFSRLAGGGVKAEGTGLGLYISRKLIEGQHGRIWATSPPGQGATFGFALPADELDRCATARR